MDYLSAGSSGGLAIPSDTLGSGMYDFGYSTAKLPPSEVATNASQLESGGSGFNWADTVNGVRDLAGIWLQIESNRNGWAGDPTPQLRAQTGQTYPAGQAISAPTATGMSQSTMILAGVAVLVAVVLIAKA